MKKNIALIGTDLIDPALTDYLCHLRDNFDCLVTLYASKNRVLDKFVAAGIVGRKLYLPNFDKKFAVALFIIFLPIWYIPAFLFVLFLKIKMIETIITVNVYEKILFTPLAAIFKIKNVWLECPNADFGRANIIIKKLYLFFSTRATLLTFTRPAQKQLLDLGIKPEAIVKILPAIKLNNFQRQENIFSKIAKSEQVGRINKFFNLATVIDMHRSNKFETMFKSVRNCLTVVPNLQLIIIGEGPDKKNLTWLAKKMEIDNLVWFVGEQNFLRKWLETVHVYIYTDKTLRLQAITALLHALSVGLPVIGPKDIGLDDIICENKNGCLVVPDDDEDLSQAIIKLRQNRRLYQIMSENSKIIAENFSLDKSVQKIIEYI